jgi:hypothetical protein
MFHRLHFQPIFLILKKTKVGLCDHRFVCMSVYPPVNFWMPVPIFTKLGTYILAPEPISTAYIPPVSLCVYMRIPLSLLGNSSVKTLLRQQIHRQQYKNWTRCFLCFRCCIKGKLAISSYQNFLFLVFLSVIIFGEGYKWECSSWCIFLQHPLTSKLSDSNFFVKITGSESQSSFSHVTPTATCIIKNRHYTSQSIRWTASQVPTVVGLFSSVLKGKCIFFFYIESAWVWMVYFFVFNAKGKSIHIVRRIS